MLPNYFIGLDGQFNQMKRAQKKLMVIVSLALLGIFLLFEITFGNFRDAFIVMINVPCAAIGGVFALYLAGETLSISIFFVFLSLFSIAIQDGVILIMTAALFGLGLLPAALFHSIGSEAQRPLALVIIGDMVTTTTLMLLVLSIIMGSLEAKL